MVVVYSAGYSLDLIIKYVTSRANRFREEARVRETDVFGRCMLAPLAPRCFVGKILPRFTSARAPLPGKNRDE